MYGVWQYNSSCSSTGLKEHFQTERDSSGNHGGKDCGGKGRFQRFSMMDKLVRERGGAGRGRGRGGFKREITQTSAVM